MIPREHLALLNLIAQTNQRIEQQMDAIENAVFNHDNFALWRGLFEVKKIYLKKENSDIKCDLDIRLAHWPEGVVVKVYKHKALALLPSCNSEEIASSYLKSPAVASKFWKNTFNFSHRSDLDEARYILREGNDMQEGETEQCLALLKTFIIEIEGIVKK